MRRRCGAGLFLWLLLAGLRPQTAEAQPAMPPQYATSSQPYVASYLTRAMCVTDPYGVSFHNWFGSPVAYNSYFSTPSSGAYSSGYNGATTGYFWGGVPAVASATTPEWIVQRTSIFPVTPYYPETVYPRSYLPSPAWTPRFGKKSTPPNVQVTAHCESASPRSSQPASVQRQASDIQQVSAVETPNEDVLSSDIANGDRLLRTGKYTEAYLCYLAAQRDVGWDSEVYFRQAFALVAMQRYSHAVAKLKRGFQIAPDALQNAATLDEVLGSNADDADRLAKKKEWFDRVSQWAKADSRDLDRQFLMGVLLHCDHDPRAGEFLNAASKLAGRNQSLSR